MDFELNDCVLATGYRAQLTVDEFNQWIPYLYSLPIYREWDAMQCELACWSGMAKRGKLDPLNHPESFAAFLQCSARHTEVHKKLRLVEECWVQQVVRERHA